MDHKIVEAFMRVGKCHRTLLEHYLNKDGLYRVPAPASDVRL